VYNEFLYNEALYNRELTDWHYLTITIGGTVYRMLRSEFVIIDQNNAISMATVKIRE